MLPTCYYIQNTATYTESLGFSLFTFVGTFVMKAQLKIIFLNAVFELLKLN